MFVERTDQNVFVTDVEQIDHSTFGSTGDEVRSWLRRSLTGPQWQALTVLQPAQ